MHHLSLSQGLSQNCIRMGDLLNLVVNFVANFGEYTALLSLSTKVGDKVYDKVARQSRFSAGASHTFRARR